MKIALSALIGLLGFLCPVASYFLHRQAVAEESVLATAPAPAGGGSPSGGFQRDAWTGDPNLGLTASSDGGDYFAQAWTGENTGDPTRGTGACVAFRRTLKCNPSGIRDPKSDKGCQQVVNADESGFCECGNYAQFAAVDCNHRPFTCEIMCLKFAKVTKKPAVFRNNPLTPADLDFMIQHQMWANQTDLAAMRSMVKDIQEFMARAMMYTNETSSKAVQSMHKFMDMMKDSRKDDAERAAKLLADYHATLDDKPWLNIWKNGDKLINIGQAIQGKVREAIPFDPVAAGTNNFMRR
jgi:hypothetical protein